MTFSSPSSVESDTAMLDESDPFLAIFDAMPTLGKVEEAVSLNSELRGKTAD
jgi:hypothetical protein